MRARGQSRLAAVVIGSVLLVYAEPALAQATPTPNNILDTITNLFRDNASSWTAVLQTYAWNLFQLLATIEFTWSFMLLAFKGAELGEWLSNLVNQIMFIGVGAWLVQGWTSPGPGHAAGLGYTIVNSFRQAGNDASVAAGGGANFKPSDVFDSALRIISTMFDGLSLMSPGPSMAKVFAGLIILVAFALLAALLILAIVESYILINASVLLLGFVGSRWSREIGMKVPIYAVSVGAKLFILQLILGLAGGLLANWKTANTFNLDQVADCFALAGAAIVMVALSKTIPDLVQALVSGLSVAHAQAAVVSSAAAGAAAGAYAAAGQAVGSGMAAKGAGDLASELQRSGDAPASSNAIGHGIQWVMTAAKELASAGAEDFRNRVGGRPGYQSGIMLGRMGRDMSDRAESMRLERTRPLPPSDGPAGGGRSPDGDAASAPGGGAATGGRRPGGPSSGGPGAGGS